MTGPGWITNDPVAAGRLRAADQAYETAAAKASRLPLAGKVAALRDARAVRDAEYRAVMDEVDR